MTIVFAKHSLLALAVLVTAPVALPAGAATPPTAADTVTTPVLVAVRAAHHPGLDRLVFEFRGGLPARHSATYVKRLVADPGGGTVRAVGDALLQVRFAGADGHDDDGTTYGAARRTYALPGVIQVVNTGDFEAVLSFGVGLARRTPYRVYTLTRPSRVVIDIKTPYRTVTVRDHFLNSKNFAAGRRPYLTAVSRPVIPPATAYGALQRLFAGPTPAEQAVGLRFVSSKATGFSKVTVKRGVARVHLTGPYTSGGSTFTVADQIIPTLKQFPSVRWVKIYDAAGRTARPTGPSDSIPECLEP
jgi:hypothetical protein